MTVRLEIQGPKGDRREVVMSNTTFDRLVTLGAFISVGIAASPCGRFYYSEKFKNPSCHRGIKLSSAEGCRRLRSSLDTLYHAIQDGIAANREWVTDLDRSTVACGLYSNMLLALDRARNLEVC